MKKLVLSIIAVVAVVFSSSAQFGWGIKGGVNVNKMKLELNDIDIAPDARIGATGGIFFDLRLPLKLGVSLDVLYSQLGTTYKLREHTGTVSTVDMTSHYVTVPLLLNYRIIAGLAFKVGVQPGFLIAAKKKRTSQTGSSSNDISDQFKSMDIAVPLGISYQFGFGLLFDARYNFGVSNVAKIINSLTGDNDDTHVMNNHFSFTVGYRF